MENNSPSPTAVERAYKFLYDALFEQMGIEATVTVERIEQEETSLQA